MFGDLLAQPKRVGEKFLTRRRSFVANLFKKQRAAAAAAAAAGAWNKLRISKHLADQTFHVVAKMCLPWIRVISLSYSLTRVPLILVDSEPLLSHLFPNWMPEQNRSPSVWVTSNLCTSLSICVLLSAQYPQPIDGGLSEPQGLPEDHAACLRASVWALLPGLALALLLAQHAL